MAQAPGYMVRNRQTGATAWWDGQKLTPVRLEGDISEGDVAAGVAGRTAPMDASMAANLPPPPEQQTITGQPKEPITREAVGRGLGSVGRFAAEAALPLAGTVAGGAMFGLPGAVGGGMLGEAATQALGIKESAPEDIALTGVMEAALPGASRLIRGPVKTIAKKAASVLPGVSMIQKQPKITRVKSLPGKFAPETSSKQLFGELEGLDEVKIKMPTAIGKAKTLESAESRLMPKYRSPTIEGGAKQAEDFLSTAKPAKQVSTGIVGESGEPIFREIAATPDTGVPFEVAQDHLRRLGQMIRRAESGQTDEPVGALRQMRNAFVEDMTKAEEQFPALMKANKAFKQEQAVDELRSIFESTVTPIAGKSGGKASGQGAVREFDARGTLKKFEQLVNPKNAAKYDRLFADGLGDKNIKEIRLALQQLNEFGPISVGWSGGGSLVAQGAVAGAGTGIASGLMFGDPTGGIVSGLAGGLTGAAFPNMMAEALMRRPARAFLLKSLKSSGGKITHPDQFLAALGGVIQRSPTIFDEE